MTKHIALSILIFFSAMATATSAPVITFPGKVWDFGNIKPGATVGHTFLIRNNGDSELIITGVHTTCGCTAALLKQRKAPPNGELPLRVSFDATGKPGPFTKQIRVVSNASDRAATLTIKGVVTSADSKSRTSKIPRISVSPSEVDLGTIPYKETVLYTVRIGNTGKGPLYIKNLSVGKENTGEPLAEKPIKPGKKIEVVFYYKGTAKGPINDSQTILSNDPVTPVVKVKLKGVVQ